MHSLSLFSPENLFYFMKPVMMGEIVLGGG
jgi:hypothetical protein